MGARNDESKRFRIVGILPQERDAGKLPLAFVACRVVARGTDLSIDRFALARATRWR
jgi:hypothetical protein